jgi:periplasmic protein TonB
MDLDTLHKSGRRLWFCAAIGALLLHVGGAAFAVTHLKGDEAGEGLGADGVEISMDMASPKVPDDDLPAGEDDVAQQASPPMPDQVAEVKPTDLPKDIPTESDDPDRVVTTSDSKKPKEETDKVAAVQTQASPESDQHQDQSRKALDTPKEADKARAPNAGIGKDAEQLTLDWYKKLSGIFKSKSKSHYPEGKTKAAKVRVAFVLNRLGNILSADVMESSGDTAYDQAAIAIIRHSDPVPTPPAKMTDDRIPLDIWINFDKPK